MPCDYTRTKVQTAEERRLEVEAALDELQTAVQGGRVNIRIGADGGVCFAGWDDVARAGMTDVCAYRRLQQRDTWEVRQAIAAAEAQSGRKVQAQAIAAGVHSHDGGVSWGTE